VPTLLDLLGQPVPDSLQGKSLRPFLERPGDITHDEDVFIEWNGPNNGFGDQLGRVSIHKAMTDLATKEQIERATTDPVRTVIAPDGWKFNCSPLGEHELYNLKDDPLETRNLAAVPEHQPRIQDLTARIRRWQEKTGDEVAL
jgi:arylsulfatase A-like enzyme